MDQKTSNFVQIIKFAVLSCKQIICFIMATIGLVMIIGVSGTNQSHGNFTGIAFGLSAAALYATVILLNKHIKSVTGIDRTLIQFFAAIIILLPYIYLTTGIHIDSLDR
jgi:threonine/homoserine efflux transporter RhtA